jgi:hypothetical protein
MECTTSISQSLTDFAYNQSNFIQTTIMLGFISLVFLLSAMLWISSLFGKSFQQLLSDKIQDWTGALCVVTIISVLCSAAIEMNYWTGNQIPSCILDGMISSTKAVSMIVIFTLQFLFVILFVKEFIRARLSDRFEEERDGKPIGWTILRQLDFSVYVLNKLERKIPLYRNSFPSWFKISRRPNGSRDTVGKYYFFTFGLPMIFGAIYSFFAASIHWLKVLTENLGITELKLSIDFLGLEIQYSLILDKLSWLHTKWLGCPFVTPLVNVIVSILITGWFMWRFRLIPRVPWVLRKLFSNKSKVNV